ncbi:hypothetical protein AMURIS_03506 [Acetatifactor muris]|uniref:O-Antigen ligase n=2 Tax=Acetatifactor muris TaxID=879566 RepID=A0A2K4ZJZ4_9FIRM|nr:hypothetical protein AMURIS_03506 [Acetatifactor muris]
MKKRKNVIYNVWFAYVMFYICFKHLFANDNFLYLIMDVIFFMIILEGIYCEVRINNRAWWGLFVVLIIDMFFTVFYAISIADAVKFSIVYLNFIAIGFWFTQLSGWQTVFYKWIKAGCLFHLIFTYFSVIFTEQALKITRYFYTDNVQQTVVRWAKEFNFYAGISGQTGTNAFFFAILIGLFFAELRVGHGNKLTRILFYASWGGMLFTGKKGLLIAAFLSILAVYCATCRKAIKRKLLITSSVTFFPIILLCIIFYKQLYDLFYFSIFTRVRIMNGMLLTIRERPFLGSGVNSVGKFTYDGHLGHNIYLQMWAEQGIVGLIILLLALWLTLRMTYVRIKGRSINEGSQMSSFFSFYMQVFVIIYGFFGNPLYDYNVVVTYFIAIAAGFADIRPNNIAMRRTLATGVKNVNICD